MTKLTKKRYEEIGKIFRRDYFFDCDEHCICQIKDRKATAIQISSYFAKHDKNFKKDLFLKQCGVRE